MSDKLVAMIVIDDKTAIHAISNDDEQNLIDCIEDLQELTGATHLKITIEAFKE